MKFGTHEAAPTPDLEVEDEFPDAPGPHWLVVSQMGDDLVIIYSSGSLFMDWAEIGGHMLINDTILTDYPEPDDGNWLAAPVWLIGGLLNGCRDEWLGETEYRLEGCCRGLTEAYLADLEADIADVREWYDTDHGIRK